MEEVLIEGDLDDDAVHQEIIDREMKAKESAKAGKPATRGSKSKPKAEAPAPETSKKEGDFEEMPVPPSEDDEA